MNQEEIEEKYPINTEYLLDSRCEDGIEKVELQRIDGISAFINYVDRPLMHPVRYDEVTIFRLQPLNNHQQSISQEMDIKCRSCQHWTRLSEIYDNINTSKFGRCSNPKIFGWDYVEHESYIDAHLTSGDEVVIAQEYCTKPTELESVEITTGESFGCVHFKQPI